MVLLRKWRRSVPAALHRIQIWWRGVSVRIALRKLLKASVAVQRWRRRQVLRRRLRRVIMQVLERHKSARCLQSFWRGVHTRRRYAKELELLRKARSKRRAMMKKAEIEGRRRLVLRSVQRAGTKHVSTPASDTRNARQQPCAGEEVSPIIAKALQAPVLGKRSSNARPTESMQLKLLLDGRDRGPLDGKLDKLSPRSPRDRQIKQDRVRSPRDSGNYSSNTVRSPRTAGAPGSSSPAVASRAPLPDAELLLTELVSIGLLSDSPRAPPWPHEQPGTSDLEAVRSWLAASLPSSEVRVVLRVDCALATAAYKAVSTTLGPERLLWHGTPWDSVANIVRHGFNRAYSGRHGAKLGRGSYFAEDAAYALRFCGRSAPRALFLAGVLPGRCCRGEENLVEPPADKSDASGARFDSTVDDPERPKVFCVFKDFQALPLYLAEIG